MPIIENQKAILLEVESGSLYNELSNLIDLDPETGQGGSNIGIELFVYDNNDRSLLNQLNFKLQDELLKSIFVYSDKTLINPGYHMRLMGYSSGVYFIKYNFWKNLVGSSINDKLIINQISPSRKEISILLPEKRDNLHTQFKLFSMQHINTQVGKLKTYLIFDGDKEFLIVNAKYDNNILYLKLYNELDTEIEDYASCWIAEQLINPYEDRITLYTEVLDDFDGLNYLRGPSIDYKKANITYRTTPLENFESLVSTDRHIQDELISLYISSSLIEGISLNIDYRDFKNFVHFSSAEERLKTFKYKIGRIEFYDSKITTYYTGAIGSASNSTPEISSSIEYFKNSKFDVINSFDLYERYLYYDSHSYESGSEGIFTPATWPKYTDVKPYLLYSISSSNAGQWYSGIINSASIYDNMNSNRLINFIPFEMQLDPQNQQYIKMINMIGHYLDINYNYINRMTSIHERENPLDLGIPRELILHAINHYGFDLRSGFVTKKLHSCIPTYLPTSSI